MDAIPYISMAMAHENVMAAVGTSMLEASLDLASTEVADLTKAMELSVNPAVGGNIDIAV
ncbi:MAG: YjfB family protein [Lachnospiraceae bacterium]|nr:YjfB family protein [Lachnospiraceae bacterium]